MKRFVALMLCLILAMPALCGLAEDEKAYLTKEELTDYVETLRAQALADDTLKIEKGDEDGVYIATFSKGEMTLAGETLDEDTAILTVTLSDETLDARGIAVRYQGSGISDDVETAGASLEDVTRAYPLDNPDFTGTFNESVLYLGGEIPGRAYVGYALRDGQRVQSITYLTMESSGDQVLRMGVTYTFSENLLSGITLFGIGSAVEEESAMSELSTLSALQEDTGYRQYPVSASGQDVDIFQREDMTFSGYDFLSADYDAMTEMLGAPQSDTWMQDSNGEYLRTCVWSGMQAIYLYDSSRNFLNLNSIQVLSDTTEGPRGVRVGDMMYVVRGRFRFGEGTDAAGEALYGDGKNAPYAMLTYSGSDATLTYVSDIEGENVFFQVNFTDMSVTSWMLLRRAYQ